MDWHKRFKSKGCSLKLAAQDKEAALSEVVDNLVKGGVLDAALAEDAKSALLSREEMASTGVGMNVAIPHVRLEGLDEATRRRVFEPFYTTKPTGRGLGMATVLGILRAHKGAVNIETAPGEGTRIKVAFPPVVSSK